ncbi:hypothetical protein DFH07DRAFT_763665 [Mycena maculata]|uniref:Uncharacterized protein n=1 Tax=Mycena maculata TaxID=230809 RepID=A0AAD7KGD3_9AGAR|nr:hypothetical protein DFH07DRAFT_763665 [Mycena maculata]
MEKENSGEALRETMKKRQGAGVWVMEWVGSLEFVDLGTWSTKTSARECVGGVAWECKMRVVVFETKLSFGESKFSTELLGLCPALAMTMVVRARKLIVAYGQFEDLYTARKLCIWNNTTHQFTKTQVPPTNKFYTFKSSHQKKDPGDNFVNIYTQMLGQKTSQFSLQINFVLKTLQTCSNQILAASDTNAFLHYGADFVYFLYLLKAVSLRKDEEDVYSGEDKAGREMLPLAPGSDTSKNCSLYRDEELAARAQVTHRQNRIETQQLKDSPVQAHYLSTHPGVIWVWPSPIINLIRFTLCDPTLNTLNPVAKGLNGVQNWLDVCDNNLMEKSACLETTAHRTYSHPGYGRNKGGMPR